MYIFFFGGGRVGEGGGEKGVLFHTDAYVYMDTCFNDRTHIPMTLLGGTCSSITMVDRLLIIIGHRRSPPHPDHIPALCVTVFVIIVSPSKSIDINDACAQRHLF